MQKVVAPPTGVSIQKSSGPIAEDLYSEKVIGTTNSFRDILSGLNRQMPDLEAAAHWGKITETDIKALERKDMKAISPELKQDLDDRARELGTKKLDTSRLLPEFRRLVSEVDAEFSDYKDEMEARFGDLCDAFSTPHHGSVAAESAAAQGLGQIEALLSDAKHFSDLPGLVHILTSELRKFEEILEQCRSEREELAKVTARADAILKEGAKEMADVGTAAALTELHSEVLPTRGLVKPVSREGAQEAQEKKRSPEAKHSFDLDVAGFEGEVAMKILRVLVSEKFFGKHQIGEEGMTKKVKGFTTDDVKEQLKLLIDTGIVSPGKNGGGLSVQLDALPKVTSAAVTAAFKYWCEQYGVKLRSAEGATA